MGFDYRELATKVLFAQGKQDDEDDQGGNGTATRCMCCETTQGEDEQGEDEQGGNGTATRCPCCHTTEQDDDPKCKQCNTTKPHDDEPGRRYAQDLTVLRQQLRDSLGAQ